MELNNLCDVVALSHCITRGHANNVALTDIASDDVMLVKVVPSHNVIYGGDVEEPSITMYKRTMNLTTVPMNNLYNNKNNDIQ